MWDHPSILWKYNAIHQNVYNKTYYPTRSDDLSIRLVYLQWKVETPNVAYVVFATSSTHRDRDRRWSTSVSVMEFEKMVLLQAKKRDSYMYVTVMGMVITLLLLVLFFLYRDDCFWRCIQVINSTKDTNNKNNNEKYFK